MGYNNKEIEGTMSKKEVDLDSTDDELSSGGEEAVQTWEVGKAIGLVAEFEDEAIQSLSAILRSARAAAWQGHDAR